MSESEHHEGGCLCGAVRYQLLAPPRESTLCHCRSCRRASGAPSLGWVVMGAGDVAFTGQAPASHRSSEHVVRQFCSRCGTQLTYRDDQRPEVLDITTATLDDPDAFPPSKEIWLDHKIAWEAVNASADHFAQSSRNAAPLPKP